MSDDALRRAFDRAVSRAGQREGRAGVLGRADGTIAYADPAGTVWQDRAWARVGDAEIVVRCTCVPPLWGLPVIIADRDGVPTVIRTDTARALAYTGNRPADVPRHAWLHGRFGADALYIPGAQVLPLMARPASPPNMTVVVEEAFYRYGGTLKRWATAASSSLAAYIPAAAASDVLWAQHFAVLCLDRDANALAVVDGTTALTGSPECPFDGADVELLTIPAAYRPIAAVRFYQGQATIEATDIFIDLRFWGGEHLGVPGIEVAGTPAAGQAPVWDGAQWVATDVATQAELDAAALDGAHIHVYQEDHSGECDGATTEFATTHTFEPGTTMVWLNGLLQRPGSGHDYTESASGAGLTLAIAPLAGDALLIAYIKATSGEVSGPYTGLGGSESAYLVELHCHTTESDGVLSPADLVAAYAAAGLDALAITDHDMVTAQPAGIDTAIQGNELSPDSGHLVSLSSDYTRGAETDQQTLIDAVVADGGQVILAHPKWLIGHSYANMAARTGYLGIEIHNAHCVDGAGQNPVTYPGFDIADWDALLTNVRRAIWGFSVDDFHADGITDRVSAGRLRVFVAENTGAAIKAALAAGDFVADVSNDGVTPGIPTINRLGVSLACPGAKRLRFIGDSGALLQQDEGESGSYSFDGDEAYVRVEAVGAYEETFDGSLPAAWYTSAGSWSAAGGVLRQASDTKGPHLLVLRRHAHGDLDITLDINCATASTAVNVNAGLWWGLLTASYGYLVQFSPNDDAVQLYKATGGAWTAITQATKTLDRNAWYSVRVRYTQATGAIKARVWARGSSEPATWDIDTTDTSLQVGGMFALRCRYIAEFDNLSIDGFKTYYQPIPVGDWS